MRERARAHLDAAGEAPVAPARDAATVVLLRDSAAGPEVYLMRRAPSMLFAAGMYVFPGGAVDPRDGDPVDGDPVDGDPAGGWAGPPPGQWARWLGCDEELARALVRAAVRETFEESGVLLAGPDAALVLADTTGPDLEEARAALVGRRRSITEVLARRGLMLRSDLLRAWAHWITPEFEPRRFDTRFFVAAAPAGQRPRDVSGEADTTVWMSVPAAVEGYDAGRLPMLPPTIACLREIAAYDTVADVLADVREVRPVLPRLVRHGDRLTLDLSGGRE